MDNQLINPLSANDDVCSICLDNLNKEQIYQLPECGHKYHTNCIMQWMRSGHCKCPYCGNIGDGLHTNNDNNQIYYSFFNHDQYIVLRRFSRRKDAPIKLKKQITQLKTLEQKLKKIHKQYTELLSKSGIFKTLNKQYIKFRKDKWLINSRIRRLKRDICTSNFITPLILVKKKII